MRRVRKQLYSREKTSTERFDERPIHALVRIRERATHAAIRILRHVQFEVEHDAMTHIVETFDREAGPVARRHRSGAQIVEHHLE